MGAAPGCVRSSSSECPREHHRRGERVLGKQIISKGPVEPIDANVVAPLARMDVLDGNAGVSGPATERLAQRLKTVVCSAYLGQGTPALQPIEELDKSNGSDRRIHVNLHGLTVEVV